MKISLRLLALLFLTASVSSCQKELTDPMTPVAPPVVTPSDSVTLLSRIAYVDINNSTAETGYYDFAFDSLKRVHTITLSAFNNGITYPITIVTYYYNANDTLAWKKTEIDDDPSDGYSYTYFYFYDNQQRLIKDSTLYQPGMGVRQYKYTNTMITAAGVYYDPADPSTGFNFSDTGLVNANGNIIQTNSLYDMDHESVFLSYDSHPNPLFSLNIRSAYNPITNFDFFIEDFTLQKNNLVSSNKAFNSSLETYTYTYDVSGYPSMVDISYDDVPQDNYRLVFYYKKI